MAKELTAESLTNDFLDCIEWTGIEDDRPRGVTLPAGITPQYLAKDWNVDHFMDLEVDEEKVAKVMNRYGSRAILLALAGTNKTVDRWEWKELKKTDGLLLYLTREWQKEKTGGGVQVAGRTINRPPPRF